MNFDMTLSMSMSVGMHNLLRILSEHSVPSEVLYTWDQRTLGACYHRGWFKFDKDVNAVITDFGLSVWEMCQSGVRERVNSGRPLFIENERRRRRERGVPQHRVPRRNRV